jgi:hypothetical protein
MRKTPEPDVLEMAPSHRVLMETKRSTHVF